MGKNVYIDKQKKMNINSQHHTWLLLAPTNTNKHVCLEMSSISTLSAKNTYLEIEQTST